MQGCRLAGVHFGATHPGFNPSPGRHHGGYATMADCATRYLAITSHDKLEEISGDPGL